MSTDATSASDQSDTVDAIADRLGEAIVDLPEYQEYEEAQRAVESDPDLQAKIAEFEELRESFAADRQRGAASQEDVETLRQAQQELHGHPTMAAFLSARERLRDRLEELNRRISGPLTVDFGGEAGGCCKD